MTVQIGSLTNVPAPGDAIRSPWAQDVSRLGLHVFATKAALDAGYATAVDGAHAHTVDTGTDWLRTGGVWVALVWRRMLRGGTTAVTTDGSGGFSITHGLNGTPLWVTMSGDNDVTATRVSTLICIGKSATIFSGRAWRTDTNVGLASTGISIAWSCGMAEPAGAPRALQQSDVSESLPDFAVGLPIYDGDTGEQLHPGDPPVTPVDPEADV